MVLAAECRFVVKSRAAGSNAIRDVEDDFFEEDDDTGSELVGVLCTPFPATSQRRHQNSPQAAETQKSAPTTRGPKNPSSPQSSRGRQVAKVHSAEIKLLPENGRSTRGSASKPASRGKGSHRLPAIEEELLPSRENSESKASRSDCLELQSEHKGWRLGKTVLPVESSQSDECDDDDDDDDDDIFSENFMGSKSDGTKAPVADDKVDLLDDAQAASGNVIKGEEITPDAAVGKGEEQRVADATVSSEDVGNVEEEEVPCGSAATSTSEPTSEPPTVPRKDRRPPKRDIQDDETAIPISVYDFIPESISQTPSEGSEAASETRSSGLDLKQAPKQNGSEAEEVAQHSINDKNGAAGVPPAQEVWWESRNKADNEFDEMAGTSLQQELKLKFLDGTAAESPSPPPEMRMQPSKPQAPSARQADAVVIVTRPGSDLTFAAKSRQGEATSSPEHNDCEREADRFVAPPEAFKGFITGRGKGVTISDTGREKAEEVLGDLSALALAAPSQRACADLSTAQTRFYAGDTVSSEVACASISPPSSHSISGARSASARAEVSVTPPASSEVSVTPPPESIDLNASHHGVGKMRSSSEGLSEGKICTGTQCRTPDGVLEDTSERADLRLGGDFGRESNVKQEVDEAVGNKRQREAFTSDFYGGSDAAESPPVGMAGGLSSGRGKAIKSCEAGVKKEAHDVSPPASNGTAGSPLPDPPRRPEEGGLEESNRASPVCSADVEAPSEGLGGFATGRGKSVKISDESIKRANRLLGDRDGHEDETPAPWTARPGSASPTLSGSAEAPSGGRVGFTTGRGKAVKISEEGVKKASAMFSDLEVGSESSTPQAPADSTEGSSASDGLKSCSGKTGQPFGDEARPDPKEPAAQRLKRPFVSPIREEEEEAIEAPMGSNHGQLPSGGCMGFATGRGKAVKISEESVKKASAMFSDLEAGSDAPMQQAPADSIQGPSAGTGSFSTGSFSTGRGKGVHISESDLRKTEQLFGDSKGSKRPFEEEVVVGFAAPMYSDRVETPSGGHVGFATGRGKTVKLDDEAVKKANALFADLKGVEEAGSEAAAALLPIQSNHGASTGSFSTGRGKGVQISESARRKSEKLLGEDSVEADSKMLVRESSNGKEPAVYSTPSNSERLLHNTMSEPSTVHRAQPQTSILKTSSASGGVGLITPVPKRTAEAASTSSTSSTTATKSRRPFKAPRLLKSDTPSGNAAGKAPAQPRYHQPPPASCVTPLRDPGEGGHAKTIPSIQRRISSASNVTPQLLFSSPEGDSQIRAMSKTLNFKGFTSSEDFIRRMQHAVPLSLAKAVHGQTPFSDESNGNIEIVEYMKIVGVTSSNAAAFRLSASGSHFFDSDAAGPSRSVGAEDMLKVLVSNHQKSSDLTAEWVTNHYRWIVWKLAAMERAFPSIFGGHYLTADRVYLQLLNRFDREVVRGERSVVKEILDRDQVANNPMVLCVSHAVQQGDDSVHLMLSDGWHEIGASIDSELTRLATCGKIFVGQKLRIFGADRDMDESKPVTLKLTINGVSRATWDEKLGRVREAPCVGLRCIRPGGGLVPAVRVVVQRVFPKVFMETCGDGTKVWRSEAAEVRAQQAFEDRVNREWEKYVGKQMDSSQLGHSSEADGGEDGGMAEQVREREKQLQEWRESFMEQEEMTVRKVCSVLKLRVSCLYPSQPGRAGGDAYLTWWRPGESMTAIQEGSAFVIRNVQANDVRKNGLPCLSFMRETRCTPVQDSCVASVYRPRRVVGVEDIGSCSVDDELDVCGAVVEISDIVMDIGRSGLPCRKQHLILTGPSLLSLLDEDAETCMDSPSRTCYLRIELGVDSIVPLRISAAEIPCVFTIRNLKRPRLVRESGSIKVYACQAFEEAEILQSPPARPRHAAAQLKQTSDALAWEAIRAWLDRSRDEVMSGEVSLANLNA